MTDALPANERKYFHSLDLLKFLLALVIFFHHFQQFTEVKFDSFNFFYGDIYFGYAVEFFFIISGFVSAAGLKKELPSFKSYAIKKAVRIYPMVFLSTFFACLVFCFYKLVFGSYPMDSGLGLWRVLNCFTLTFSCGALELGFVVNNPLWYLCALLICYVWLYFIQWLGKALKINPVYGFAVMSLVGISAWNYKLDIPFFSQHVGRAYASFFWGLLLFYINKALSKKLLIPLSAVLFLASSFSVLTGKFCDNDWGILTFMLFPSVLEFFLFSERFVNGEAVKKTFKFLGGVSFEIYIWHMPWIFALVCARALLGWSRPICRMDMLASCAIVFVFSCLVYKFVEIPLTERLRTRFGPSMEGSPRTKGV